MLMRNKYNDKTCNMSNNSRVVHYLSFYLDQNYVKGRKAQLSAQQKIRYISSSIVKAGAKLKIISTAVLDKSSGLFLPKTKVKISENEEQIYLSAINPKTKLAGLYLKIITSVYLLFCVKKGDCVIVNHSLAYSFPLKIFKLFKKNHLILEFNDLYHLLFTDSKKIEHIRKKEEKLFPLANSFILASPFMRELIGNAKSIVNYGSYTVAQDIGVCKADDHIIIYTGVIENLRKGAFVVAECAKYLPQGYRVQIAGFGSADDIERLKEVCLATNKVAGRVAVEYVGCLNQEELSVLMGRACLAINAHTYAQDEIWKSKYSFPSKIPLNMAHGLPVVTYPYEIITTSPMSDACIYFEELTAESMAKAIVEGVNKACNSNMDPRGIIARMDETFVADLKELLNQ